MGDIQNRESLQFNFSTIRDATDNFSDASKIGQGGFGAVYKGVLSDGQQIAVKRMSMNSKQADLEFQKEVLQYVELSNDETETADNVINACSNQGDAVVAAAVAARVDTVVNTAGKDNKKSASGVPSIITEGDAGAAGVDTIVDTAGKDNKKSASGVPSITEGDVGAVAGVDTVVVAVGKDNKKSTNGVPSITEGDTGAATDDYRKKLYSHSASQTKVPHPTKKPCKKDNKLVPPANKKEDTTLLKATENVKGDVVVDQANAKVQQIRNKEFIVYRKKSHSCVDTDQLEVSCSTKMPTFPQQLSGERACKKKLLVLDINGILADIVPACGKFMGQVIVNKKAVCMRPYCDDFLKFCFERFNVGVWSSRDRKNLMPIVNYLFKDFEKKLLFILDNSHCTRTGYYTIENNKKPLVLKELKKLWENLIPDLPWKKGEYNETNTLLLDDSPYKALRNPAHTAVFPHSYNYNDYNKDISLGNGGDLQRYLKDLATTENVQVYVQQHPYGEEDITQSHPDWDFYSNIIFE